VSKALSIVIPTYNEGGNITPLVERIAASLSGYDYEILLVDDNSQDGTPEIVAGLSTRYPVDVAVRKNERGLASAVVHGIARTGGDRVLVMDADLQHPPEVIPDLLKAADDGADIVVGSRYVKGGGCQDWSAFRKLVSRVSTIMAHIFLPPTRSVKDPMSGFFMFDRKVVANAKLQPLGYKILLEVLMEGKYKKATEVPFTFVTRDEGESKLNIGQQVQYIKHLYSLMRRKGELWRFIKFCLVGGSGIGVNFGIFALLTRFGGMKETDFLALAIATETAIITNFILNDIFTFRDRRSSGRFLTRLLKFNVICVAGALVQAGVYALLFHAIGIYDLVSYLIGIIVATLWNYLLNTWITWR
jgi:dolichol-phosphate mannosyltransferase